MCPSSVKSLLWLIPYAFEGNEYATPFGRHSLWAFSKELLEMDTQKCHFFILKGYWILSLGILKGFIFPFHSCFFSAALTHKQRGLNLPGLARRKFPLQSDGKKPRGSVQVVIFDYESSTAPNQPPRRRQAGRWRGRKEEFLIIFPSLISPRRCSLSSSLSSNRSYQGWRKLAVLLNLWKYIMVVPWRITLWASHCFLSWKMWDIRKCSERQVMSLCSEYKNSLTALCFPACLCFADMQHTTMFAFKQTHFAHESEWQLLT